MTSAFGSGTVKTCSSAENCWACSPSPATRPMKTRGRLDHFHRRVVPDLQICKSQRQFSIARSYCFNKTQGFME